MGLHRFERIGVFGTIAIMVAVAFRFAVPASVWFTVEHMDVVDAPTCEAVTVDLTRTIHRDFHGSYQVQIDRHDGEREEITHAAPTIQIIYERGKSVPSPASLSWFTSEDICRRLQDGLYEITVHWTINPGSWFFERHIRRVDMFRIGAPA